MIKNLVAKAKENWFRLIICLFLLIIALAELKSCQNKQKLNNNELKLELFSKIQAFQSRKTKDSLEIVNQRIIVASEKEAIAAGKLEITKELKKFKEIVAQIRVSTTYTYPTTVINYKDSNSVVTIDSTEYLKLPQNLDYTSEWLKFRVNVSRQGLIIDSLKMVTKSTITIGKVKQGFMKPYVPELIISNSNPYATTDTLSSVIIQKNLKWHQKPLNTFGLGSLATLAVLTTIKFLIYKK